MKKGQKKKEGEAREKHLLEGAAKDRALDKLTRGGITETESWERSGPLSATDE